MTEPIKRPAFQFYAGDWLQDANLRMVSSAARGLWIDMIALMHQAKPYGHLVLAGKPIEPAALAKLTGNTTKETIAWVREIKEADVCGIDDDGRIYSRRMVRDELLRNVRASGGHLGGKDGEKGGIHGSKGGRPAGQGGVNNPPPDANEESAKGGKEPPSEPPIKPPPSSSSSSSTASTTERTGDSTDPSPVDNPTPVKSSTSTPRAAAHSLARAEQTKRDMAEAAKNALPPDAPLPESVTRNRKRRPGVTHANGKDVTEDHPHETTQDTAEPPWWHSPAGITRMGTERGVNATDEGWDTYRLRVFAASGPGPWDDEQPVEVRKRIAEIRSQHHA